MNKKKGGKYHSEPFFTILDCHLSDIYFFSTRPFTSSTQVHSLKRQPKAPLRSVQQTSKLCTARIKPKYVDMYIYIYVLNDTPQLRFAFLTLCMHSKKSLTFENKNGLLTQN